MEAFSVSESHRDGIALVVPSSRWSGVDVIPPEVCRRGLPPRLFHAWAAPEAVTAPVSGGGVSLWWRVPRTRARAYAHKNVYTYTLPSPPARDADPRSHRALDDACKYTARGSCRRFLLREEGVQVGTADLRPAAAECVLVSRSRIPRPMGRFGRSVRGSRASL